MRNVIQKLIETEAEATHLVAAAKAEAERIVSEAQKNGDELAARVRQQTRLEAEKLLEAATQEAEQEKRVRLARAAVEIQTHVGLDDATRQCAIEGVVRCVCGLG